MANATGSNTVTFANAFTTNAYSITLTPVSSQIVTTVTTNAISNTGFTLFCGNSTFANTNTNISAVNYFAIGY